MNERSPDSAKSLLVPVTIILIACFAVYFNSLFNGFVYDDDFQVLQNPWIKDIRHLPEIFSTNVWSFRSGFSNYYRPLMHVIYMITYSIFGLKPWGFHLVNVLLHAGNSVLVFIIAARLIGRSSSRHLSIILPSPPEHYSSPSPPLEITAPSSPLSLRGGRVGLLLSPPFIAAILFAVHPIHTEAVAWVAGLPELSFTLFFLLSFYLYILSTEKRKGAYILSLSAFSLAALCKEPALTLPAVLVAYDYAFRKVSLRRLDDLKRYVPYVGLALTYLLIRYNVLGSLLTNRQSHDELSAYRYFINVFPLFTRYLWKVFLPISLNAFHVLHPISSFFQPKGLLSLAAATAVAVAVFRASKKGGAAFVGLILFIVPLIPALYIPGLGENPFAERYLYLPSFGFVLLVGLFISRFAAYPARKTVAVALLFIITSGLYSAGTVSRNAVWKDDFSLWSDTVQKSPDGLEPHNQLGSAFLKRGQIDMAIEQYQIVLNLNPNYFKAYNNLGIAYAYKGLPDKTIEYITRSLRLEPNDANAQYNLGQAYLQKGLLGQAIAHFEKAVKLAPLDAGFRDALEKAYAMRTRAEKR